MGVSVTVGAACWAASVGVSTTTLFKELYTNEPEGCTMIRSIVLRNGNETVSSMKLVAIDTISEAVSVSQIVFISVDVAKSSDTKVVGEKMVVS